MDPILCKSKGLIVAVLLAATAPALAPPQKASLLKKKLPDGEFEHTLYLDGRRTPISFTASANSLGPEVEVRPTKEGLIYGDVTNVESGAITISRHIAFIRDRGVLYHQEGYVTVASRGRSVLLRFESGNPWVHGGDALLYEAGRFINLGHAERVGWHQGKIVGYFTVKPDGTPYEGHLYEAGEAYRQYFEWKDGQRVFTGRRRLP